MSKITELFDSLENGKKWKAGVAFSRTGALPLDDKSLFSTVAAAEEYAANGATAYPGQFIAVVQDAVEATETTEAIPASVIAYVITPGGTLQRLAATSSTGDVGQDLANLQSQLAQIDLDIAAIEEDLLDVDAELEKRAYELQGGNGITVSEDAENAKTNVSAKLSADEGNTLSFGTDGGLFVEVPEIDVPEYTLAVAATTTEGYAKTYELQKDGVAVGSKIDIPKDMVVSSGVIVKDPEGQDAGTYIELTLANSDNTKLYINVSSLLDEMPVEGTDTTTVDITVDNSTGKYVISAAVIDGSIGLTQLSEDVIALIEKAGTAVQKITTGSANGTIAVDDQDVNVKGLADAAFKGVDTEVAVDSENVITSGAVAAYVEENKTTLDTEIDANSTDEDAASAKAVYDSITAALAITRI